MYQSHWGLDETPFRTRLDPRFFYESPTHEEALARLHFLVDYQRRLGLLIGRPGSGKSFLLEVFAGELRERGVPVAKVSLLGVDRVEALCEGDFGGVEGTRGLGGGRGNGLRDGVDSPAAARSEQGGRDQQGKGQQAAHASPPGLFAAVGLRGTFDAPRFARATYDRLSQGLRS